MVSPTHLLQNDNGRLALFVSEPASEPQRVVICVHGGPGGDHRGNDDIFEQLQSMFLDIGSVYIQFDMHGVGQSGGNEQDISVRSQIIDYQSVIDFADKNFSLPIWTIGESMGGTIAALNWDNRVKRYIMLWPAFDLADTDLKPYLSEEWEAKIAETGFINDDGMIVGKEFFNELKDFDGQAYLPMPKSPMFFAHSVTDEAVPFQQSQDAVAKANAPVTFLVVPDSNHGLQDSEARKLLSTTLGRWIAD